MQFIKEDHKTRCKPQSLPLLTDLVCLPIGGTLCCLRRRGVAQQAKIRGCPCRCGQCISSKNNLLAHWKTSLPSNHRPPCGQGHNQTQSLGNSRNWNSSSSRPAVVNNWAFVLGPWCGCNNHTHTHTNARTRASTYK